MAIRMGSTAGDRAAHSEQTVAMLERAAVETVSSLGAGAPLLVPWGPALASLLDRLARRPPVGPGSSGGLCQSEADAAARA